MNEQQPVIGSKRCLSSPGSSAFPSPKKSLTAPSGSLTNKLLIATDSSLSRFPSSSLFPSINLRSKQDLSPLTGSSRSGLKSDFATLSTRSNLISSIRAQKQHLTNSLLGTSSSSHSSISSCLLSKKPLLTSTYGSIDHPRISGTLGLASKFSTGLRKPNLPSNVTEDPQPKPTQLLESRVEAEKENLPDYGAIFKECDNKPVSGVGHDLSTPSETSQRKERVQRARNALKARKACLVKVACSALMSGPNLEDPKDPIRVRLLARADGVAESDGEFILKLALYCRQELNIRSVANLLLAYASLRDECKPFLQRYYSISIRLPTDWTEVADMVASFANLEAGALPAVLRRAMVVKFADFDAYQLAKHKRVKKSQIIFAQTATQSAGDWDMESDFPPLKAQEDEDVLDCETDFDSLTEGMATVEVKATPSKLKEPRKQRFNLKRLIRLLHIREPTFHVMAILGKKYPSNEEEFRASHLPGFFEASQAGARMKLPIPETWETQIAKHGNKANIWEGLIGNKKLPYMATIRNLRNIVLAGVDDDHVQKVVNYISSEKAVIGSRMFPFQFYSAFDIINELSHLTNQSAHTLDTFKGKGGQTAVVQKKIMEKIQKRVKTMNKDAVRPLEIALNQAVTIATNHNVPPIKGQTLILCAFGSELELPYSKKSLQKQLTLRHVCSLMALMIENSCEDGHITIIGSAQEHKALYDPCMSLLQRAKFMVTHTVLLKCSTGSTALNCRSGTLEDHLTNEKWIDSLVVVHGGKGIDSMAVDTWLERYRHEVNPDLIYANVDIVGDSTLNPTGSSDAAQNMFLSGFSEQIFHSLANASTGGQLDRIENIDKRFKLAPLPRSLIDIPTPLPLLGTSGKQEWRQVRVFVSSTFTDMHGERDLINRFVLPELQRRARTLCIELRVIDLRWGVLTQSDDINEDNGFSSSLWKGSSQRTDGSAQVLACLREIERCHLFIGLLGDRYGWKPHLSASTQASKELYTKLDGLQLDLGRVSITEIEMEYAALSNSKESMNQAAFFLRDSSLLSAQLPEHCAKLFKCQDEEDEARLQSLKQRIISSGLEVFEDYPASFRGTNQGGRPMATGLEALGQRILDSLWNSLLGLAPPKDGEEVVQSTPISTHQGHDEYASYVSSEKYVPRPKAVEGIHESLARLSNGILEISGNPGSGVSTLMCQAYKQMKRKSAHAPKKMDEGFLPVLVPFFSASNRHGMGRMDEFLRYLVVSLSHIINGGKPGEECLDDELGCLDIKSLGVKAASLMALASEALLARKQKRQQMKLLLFVDGLEDYGDQNVVEWLPPSLPEGVILVTSSHPGSHWNKHLRERKEKSHQTIKIGPLTLPERKAIVRHCLEQSGKKLEETAFNNELNMLVSKRDAVNPGYLILLANEMAGFGVFEELQGKLALAGNTMSELLSQILVRLEIDFGEDLVCHAMCCMAVSGPLGLTENELDHALWLLQDPEIMAGRKEVTELSQMLLSQPRPSIPTLSLSILINAMETFLQATQGSLRQGLLLLKGGEWSKSVTDRYFRSKGKGSAARIHLVLAGVFHHLFHLESSNPRPLRSLPIHLALGGGFKLLETTICNLDYVQACAEYPDILQELALKHFNGHYLSARSMQEKFLASEPVKGYASFVRLHLTSLTEQPCLTYQLALTESPSSLPHKEAVAKTTTMNNGYDGNQIASGPCSANAPLWLMWENRPEQRDDLVSGCNMLLVKDCKSSRITAMAIEQSPVIASEELLMAFGHDDGHVLVLLAHNNEELFSLIGHGTPISALVFLPGSSAKETGLVSASQDGQMSFWDLDSQTRISSVQAHAREITGLAVSQDGLTLVSVGLDGCIKIWAGRSKTEISCIRQSTKAFNCVAFHPEKDYIIAGGWDGLVKIYDLTSMDRKAVLRGHKASVTCVAISKDAKKIASASLNGTLMVFDCDVGVACASFNVGSAILSLALSVTHTNHEGVPQILVGTRKGIIQAWNTVGGTSRPVLSVPLETESREPIDVDMEPGACTKIGDEDDGERVQEDTLEQVTTFCILPNLYYSDNVSFVLGFSSGQVQIKTSSDLETKTVWEGLVTPEPIVDLVPLDIEDASLCATIEDCRLCLVTSAQFVTLLAMNGDSICQIKIDLPEDFGIILGPSMSICAAENTLLRLGFGCSSGEFHLKSLAKHDLVTTTRSCGKTLMQAKLFHGSEELVDFKVVPKIKNAFLTLTSYQTLTMWSYADEKKLEQLASISANLGSSMFSFALGTKNYVFVTNQSGNFDSYHILSNAEDFEFAHMKSFQSEKAGPIQMFIGASESSRYFLCLHENQDITIWSKRGSEFKWIPYENQTLDGTSPPRTKSTIAFSSQSQEACSEKDESHSAWYMGHLKSSHSSGSTVDIFDIFNGIQTESYLGHHGPVSSILLTNDSDVLLSSSRDGTLRAWDASLTGSLANGSPVVGLTHQRGHILAVSKDGTVVSHEVEGGHSHTVGNFFRGPVNTLEHIRHASLVAQQEAIVIVVATNRHRLLYARLEPDSRWSSPCSKSISNQRVLHLTGAKMGQQFLTIALVNEEKKRDTKSVLSLVTTLDNVRNKSRSVDSKVSVPWAGLESLELIKVSSAKFHAFDMADEEEGSWISSTLIIPKLGEGAKTMVLVGSIHGNLRIQLGRDHLGHQQKIHQGVITGLAQWKGHLLSISLDGTLKVWLFQPGSAEGSSSFPPNLRQIGQFSWNNTPLTCLECLSIKGTPKIVVGNCFGQVFVLDCAPNTR